jgi:3-deoxy-D-manno-octulosonic-acid transferase
VIWLHLGRRTPLAVAPPLLRRLREEDDATTLVVTTEPEIGPGPAPPGVAAVQRVPADHPPFVRGFLERWRPDACVWTSAALRPAALHAATAAMPVVIAHARAETGAATALGIPAALLARVKRVMALDTRDAQTWRRLGAPTGCVEVGGALQACADPPPDDEAARRALTRQIAGRPVWFAPAIPDAVVGSVADAHRGILRRAHRALLAMEPTGQAPPGLDPVRSTRQEGSRPEGCAVDEVHEMVVLDSPRLRGLWYRMASVTLMSDTLRPGLAAVDPDAPAALGSAVVHGFHHGPHAAGYARLVAEGASLEIPGPRQVMGAVEALLAPDRAARQAHAAWSVVTRGAESTDRLALTLLDLVDG